MSCFSPLKGYRAKNGGITFRASEGSVKMNVPCGQCLGCRHDRARAWMARIIHEAELWDDNWFVTLTYRAKENADAEQLENEWYVPADMSLDKSHVQLFLKRLRKRRPGQKIRYFCAGEYGDGNGRPHYHLILFNVDFPDRVKYRDGAHPLWTSEELERIWPYGFNTLGNVTADSAGYTAQYCIKKATGRLAEDHYARLDPETGEVYWLEPEFALMSRGHRCKLHKKLGYTDKYCDKCSLAIGRKYYELYKNDFYPADQTCLVDKGVVKGTSRFHLDLLKADQLDLYEKVKKHRRAFQKAHEYDSSPKRLEDRFRVAMARNQLKRSEL